MLWLYERKFVSLLRQTESSGSAFRVNRNQSYHGRLTMRTSPILLTRQLGTVVRRETDNPNQRSTNFFTIRQHRSGIVDGSKMTRRWFVVARDMEGRCKGDGREMEGR